MYITQHIRVYNIHVYNTTYTCIQHTCILHNIYVYTTCPGEGLYALKSYNKKLTFVAILT